MRMLRRYRDRVVDEFKAALQKDYSPRETAFSASLGTFVTVMPTMGAGLIFFAVISRLSDRVNPVALFGTVIVFDSVAKLAVYPVSYKIGSLLTPAATGEVAIGSTLTTQAAAASKTLVIGNTILAAVLAVMAYFVVHHAAHAYGDLSLTDRIADV